MPFENPQRGTLRILLGIDHALVRRAIRKILEVAQPQWELVAEVGDGWEAIDTAVALRPGVVVLDIALRRLSGIDATQQIVRRAPRTPVVLFSLQANEANVRRAQLVGAKGFVVLDAAGQDLVTAIAAAAAGESFFRHGDRSRLGSR